jgi:Family of unknown function (DUF6807)/3-keto-disaccharide hydrolase
MRMLKNVSAPLAVAVVALVAVVVSGFSRTSVIAGQTAASSTNQLTAQEKKDGWTLLFDGKTLNGWRGYKRPDATTTRWKVEDGLLTVDPKDGQDTHGQRDIITTATYDRFELTWEWKIAEGGNSGLKYFVLEDMDSAIGHEYQMIDDERHADAKIGPHRQTAAFYDVLQANNRPIRPAGQFNQSRVVSNGKTIEHWLNGTKVLQYELDSPALREAIAKSKFKDVARFGKLQNGHILVQDHGDRVWYRNMKIRRLPNNQKTTPAASGSASANGRGIQVVANDSARRVDVTFDGKPFTSYIYPDTLKKPVLYPLRTSTGTLVTRGYPLESRAGERVDHPHHVGLWFNHGDVNGLDFWNNSDAIPAAQAPKMGTIRHKKVIEAKSGADHGDLVVEMEWQQPDGTPLLREQTRFVFRGTGDARSIDRITTLTALDKPVVFRDNKEGVLGMRVRRELEQPADKPEVFTDDDGKPAAKPVLNNDGVTGQYTSSEGLKGDKVWGTRGRWCMLSGKVGTEPITLAILDHPSNPNAPTYWHARGYGLFSANVFGRQVFDPKQEELTLTVGPGKSVTFRHRVLILDNAATPDSIEREYRSFSAAASSSR